MVSDVKVEMSEEKGFQFVLILILLEDGLWQVKIINIDYQWISCKNSQNNTDIKEYYVIFSEVQISW